jgi:hypothetical protein
MILALPLVALCTSANARSLWILADVIHGSGGRLSMSSTLAFRIIW